MLAEQLINQIIPPLKPQDPVRKAIQWMEELRVNQLPVIEQEHYRGLVSEDMIFEHNYEDARVADLAPRHAEVFVYHNQHFYEIMRLANLHALDVVAVLGEEDNFLGVVTLNDTLNALADTTALREPGGILVLLMDRRDYSLTEISRLVESNDAKILSSSIADDKINPQQMQVTLKLNTTDLNRIVATFERFNYNVVARFQTSEPVNIERERYDLLMRYLNI